MLLFLSDMELDRIAENLPEFDYNIELVCQHLQLDIDPYRAMRLFFNSLTRRWFRMYFDYIENDELRLVIRGISYSAADSSNL